jgi:hypothetical protein
LSELIVIANRFVLFPTLKQKIRFLSHIAYRRNELKREKYITIKLNEYVPNRDPYIGFYINR